jgi:hypothetical protein
VLQGHMLVFAFSLFYKYPYSNFLLKTTTFHIWLKLWTNRMIWLKLCKILNLALKKKPLNKCNCYFSVLEKSVLKITTEDFIGWVAIQFALFKTFRGTAEICARQTINHVVLRIKQPRNITRIDTPISIWIGAEATLTWYFDMCKTCSLVVNGLAWHLMIHFFLGQVV